MNTTIKELLKKINSSKTMKELQYKLENNGNVVSDFKGITMYGLKCEIKYTIEYLEMEIRDCDDDDAILAQHTKDLNATIRFYNKYF